MKYNRLVNKILEDFNLFPQTQTAPSTGPDQGMTQGQMNNTFPSNLQSVAIKLPKKSKIKDPKGKRSRRRQEKLLNKNQA
jgi:hypothetical protein